MYLVIIGLGNIGQNLVRLATSNNDDVVVIDSEKELCESIAKEFDVISIVGDSTVKETLEKAGVDRADALIATTNDDAVNLMTLLLAKKFGVKSLVSIVNKPEHVEMFRRAGINVQENPDAAIAAYLYKAVQKPIIRNFLSLAKGEAEIFSVAVSNDARAVNKEVKELLVGRDMQIIAIVRGDKLIIPKEGTRIEPGDLVYIFAPKKMLERVVSFFAGE